MLFEISHTRLPVWSHGPAFPGKGKPVPKPSKRKKTLYECKSTVVSRQVQQFVFEATGSCPVSWKTGRRSRTRETGLLFLHDPHLSTAGSSLLLEHFPEADRPANRSSGSAETPGVHLGKFCAKKQDLRGV